MHSFVQLLAVGVAITGAFAQYNDGYETVNLPTDPVQIRLAYQGPTAMMVSWNTFEQLTNPSVSYGTNLANLNLIATSSVSVTYPTSLTYNNHVNITGLSPYTTYYYLPQYSNATTPYTFTTARAAGDSTPYTVGVVIDMGTFGALGLSSSIPAADNPLGPNEQTTIAGMLEAINNYEFVVHPGDLAYADAWAKEEAAGEIPTGTALAQYTVVYESILNAFFDELEPITSQKAYMVNPGNHEANCDNLGTKACTVGQTNFTGYINHWRMPSNPSGGVGNMWYSYDYGMTHFVHINTETDLGNGLVGPDTAFGGPFGSYLNQQIDWLTNDLASVNRTLTPWVVALGHRPFYVSSSSNICGPCITAFETVFNTYGVDIYVNGHSHLYDRTLPIYNNVIDPNGYNNPSAPMYLTNGAGGHFAGLDTPSAIMPYTVYNQALDYAWTTLEFLNSTHMVVNGLWSANNTVFDSVTLYKAHNVAGTSTSSSTSSSVSATSSSSTSSSSTSSSSISAPLSSTSSTPTTTTGTGTGTATSSSGGPSYTNFNGLGHLYVYVNGVWMGDIGADDTWYYWPGQGVATWTAYPAAATPGGFTLYKTGYCYIDSTQAFNCSGLLAQAEVFNQNQQGDLLYNGSPAFYASSIASTLNKPSVYATPLPVSMNIIWGNLVATPASYLSATTTGITTSSSSGSAPSTTGSITGSSSSSASSTSSSSSISSTTGPITASSSSSSTSTSSVLSSISTSSSSSGAASSSTTGSSSSSTLSGSSSASSCAAVTVTASASVITVTASASVATVYITQSASTVYVTSSASASTVTITAPASTIISTLDILTTIINTSTVDILTTVIDTSTVDILTTVVDTSTLDILTTVTAAGSTVISDITLPASTVTSDITLPASTVTSDITLPASTIETTIISTLDILTTVVDTSTLDILTTVTAPGTTVISTLDIPTTVINTSTLDILSTVTAPGATVISTLDILTTVIDTSTLDILTTVTAPGTTVISTLDILTTIVDISTISAPKTTSSTFQTSSTSSSTRTSATTSTAPIQPPPANCGKDNCLRGILAKSAVATAFCSQYLMTPSLPTPTYASNCGGLPSRVSSACYCAITA